MGGKNIAMAVAGALFVAGVFVCLPMNASAMNDRIYIDGMDLTLNGKVDRTTIGWLKVSTGDKVNVTWKSGLPGSGQGFDIIITAHIPANRSVVKETGLEYIGTFTGDAPQSYMWLESGGDDVLQVWYSSMFDLSAQKIQVSVNRTQPFSEIEKQYQALNRTYNELNQSYAQLNQSYNKNLTVLYSYIYQLESYISTVENVSKYDQQTLLGQISDLQIELMHTVSMLGENDTVLLEQMALLEAKAQELNTSLANIPSFNDTLIWKQINNLSAREPVILVNNTTLVNQTVIEQTLVNQTVVNQTLVNQTPVQYVNKTEAITGPDSTAQAVGAGVVAGVGSGAAVSLVGRRKKDELTPIPPAE